MYQNRLDITHLILVLIDTWWNVNLLNVTLTGLPEWVLIDTWWNVNVCGQSVMDIREKVLIDTWWNVNDFDIFRYANLFAF